MRPETLDILKALFESNKKVENFEGLEVSFTNKAGASEEELTWHVNIDEVSIPEDYISLLRNFNGFTLFQFEDIGGFSFYGAEEVNKETRFLKESYEEDWDSSLIVFCSIIGNGDFIAFRTYPKGTYDILDCYHDDVPANWMKICDSLEEFIEKLISSKGNLYWL
ncbi:SMI1/KNR4 family protein [Sabulibacter ruber]|uniref:SMI1/KNR4 family protein n=1 Tax=Sabulibacter ruber TaxID=2811901 RepID=UPI003100CA19